MPTGYTCYIEDGKITTGKDFLELCLRQFGVSVSMKDEPLLTKVPQSFTVDPYYSEKLNESIKNLEDIKSLSIDDIKKGFDKQIASLRDEDHKEKEEAKIALERYAAVKKDIVRWNPPTTEHEGIKSFALDQIDMCVSDLEKRLVSSYYTARIDEIEKMSIEDYKNSLIRKAEDDIAYYISAKKEEEERIKNRNEFLRKFRESLEDL